MVKRKTQQWRALIIIFVTLGIGGVFVGGLLPSFVSVTGPTPTPTPEVCCPYHHTAVVVCASDCEGCDEDCCDYTCDGVEDEAQINSAFEVGRTVQLSDGTFNVTAGYVNDDGSTYAIGIPDDSTLMGEGPGTTIVWEVNSVSFAAISNEYFDSGGSNIAIKDLTLDGDDKGYGIYLNETDDAYISRVVATDCDYAVAASSCDYFHMTDSTLYGNEYGFAGSYCDYGSFDGCVLRDNTRGDSAGRGAWFNYSNHCALAGLKVVGNNQGLYFYGGENNSIVRCIIDANTNIGAYLIYTDYSTIADCEITDNGANQPMGGIILYSMNGADYVESCAIRDCHIINNDATLYGQVTLFGYTRYTNVCDNTLRESQMPTRCMASTSIRFR